MPDFLRVQPEEGRRLSEANQAREGGLLLFAASGFMSDRMKVILTV